MTSPPDHHRRLRRRYIRVLLGALVLALLFSGATVLTTSRHSSNTAEAASGALLRSFLTQHRAEILQKLEKSKGDLPGAAVVNEFMAAQGFHCLLGTDNRILDDLIGVTPYVGALTNVCWQDTSPDPSFAQRRAYSIDVRKAVVATVNTGDPRTPLNVRSTPTPGDLRKPGLGTLKHGDKITIYCQTRGQNAPYGPYAPTTVWDYIGDDTSGMTRFVSDGSVYTGTGNFVTPQCPQSVAGYGAGKR